MILSDATKRLWAKTGDKDQPHAWEPLYIHLSDTAEVMRLIWRHWASPHLKDIICESTGGISRETAEQVVCLIAGLHDIGKAYPCFQGKVPDRWEEVQEAGLGSGGVDIMSRYLHAAGGEVLVREWLMSALGWSEDVAISCASIIGNHHGASPSYSLIQKLETSMHLPDAEQETLWEGVSYELMEWIWSNIPVDKAISVPIEPRAQILITGMLIMADWMASNQELCPLVTSIADWQDSVARAECAYNKVGLPHSWKPVAPDDNNLLFRQQFRGLPADAQLRPMQELAVSMAREVSEPQLMIIEDSMGNGKTEAALLSAEIIAERLGCTGIAYLLPTQATTDAMYDRVYSWLDATVSASHGNAQSIRLMHGKAMLNPKYRELVRKTVWLGDSMSDDETVVANAWLNGNKRGLLSPCVVGTVDQLLHAALCAKHVHLWHVGLANKIVVIDEVHAYDAYMSVYLDQVLSYLGRYGVPVILLSATLPAERRQEMIWSYRNSTSARARRRDVLPPVAKNADGHLPYPLLTMASNKRASKPTYHECPTSSRRSNVELTFMADGTDTLMTFLSDVLVDGGCVCVLRNTVKRAQETYGLLHNLYPDDTLLVHSRFVSSDRAKNDSQLLRLLGKSGERPQRLIVVATQVVEQSLDIDFDLIISDIAPIDLLLQRMGRLHRHQRGEGEQNRPAGLRKPRIIVVGADWDETPPEIDAGICHVYERSILWRTVAVIRHIRESNRGIVRLPQDIPDLVSAVYDKDDSCMPVEWEDAMEKADEDMLAHLERKRAKAQSWLLNVIPSPTQLSLDGWMKRLMQMPGESQGNAAVRDIEHSVSIAPTVYKDGKAVPVAWVDFDAGTVIRHDRRQADRQIAYDTVSLPLVLACQSYEPLVLALTGTFAKHDIPMPQLLDDAIPVLLESDGTARVTVTKKEFVLCYHHDVGLSAWRVDASTGREEDMSDEL